MLKNIQNVITMLVTLRYLLGLIEPIRDLVRQVEQPGNGPAKKQAVLDIIDTVIPFAEAGLHIELPEDTIREFASAMIDVIVSIENAIGVFRHRSEPVSGGD